MIAFGAAAATAGATSMAACGGDTRSNASDGGQSDATPVDASPHRAPEAGWVPDEASGASYGACPIAVRDSDILPWKVPVATPDACSPADMATLRSELMNPNATFTDVYKALSSKCAACVFSDQASTNYQPIVWSPDMAAGTAFVNFGSCYAVAPGGSASCGKGVQDEQSCLQAACPMPDCDGTDMGQGCQSSAAMGDCMKYTSEVLTGCGSNTAALDKACGSGGPEPASFMSLVDVVCGSGPGDGGSSDSGSD
jgi:hypothetical protein